MPAEKHGNASTENVEPRLLLLRDCQAPSTETRLLSFASDFGEVVVGSREGGGHRLTP